jgi:endonuclease-8
MPEGPSIVILREAVSAFGGKKVLRVAGNTKEDKERLVNKKVLAFRSWGKHFLIVFKGFAVRIHFLLFGSYRINEEKETAPRLSLAFKDGELNFYACSVKFIEGDVNDVYDWSADIMADQWDPAAAVKKLKAHPDMLACDALLDQDIFAGSGNIIKNEVLWRIKMHPLTQMGAVKPKQLRQLADETRNYAFDFLEWKKTYVLKKNWKAHTKRTCARCELPLVKEYLGKTNRRTFYCPNCQVLHEM